MALSDGPITAAENEALNARMFDNQARLEQAAAMEASRTSAPALLQMRNTYYTYVVIDAEVVRIQKVRSTDDVVSVPETIEDKPVVALSPDSFSGQADICDLSLPDTIASIGGGAFRSCTGLRRVKLPANLDDFNSGWFTFCKDIEELWLSGCLENIRANVFDLPALKKLHIGVGTKRVEPGAFQKSQLEEITVSADNPHLKTDGRALYSHNGEKLWVLAVPCSEYEVCAGTKTIARKAFSSFAGLERAGLPDSVEDIGEFAFTRTGISEFRAPANLKRIREKAFFRCAALGSVTLNEGLEEVGEEAFASTALSSIEFPRSIQVIARRVTADTAVIYSRGALAASNTSNTLRSADDGVCMDSRDPSAITDAAPTFIIPPDAKYLSLDEQGVLYSTLDGSSALVQVVEPAVTQIKVRPGTTRIADGAARNHKNLSAVKVPEGVTTIEREAFKGCKELYWVELPDSITRIEDEAFLDTVLQHINLPASLDYLGTKALITYGAHHTGTISPTLKEVVIPKSLQERYFVVPGLLCQRREDNSVRVMVCLGAEEIHVPADTTTIDEYAFGNARGIRTLYFSDKIHSIGMCGFALACWVEHIHVDLTHPVGGHDHFDFYFPFNDRAVQQIKLTFSMMRSIDLHRLFNAYDQVICNGAGLQGGHGDSGMTLYDQAQRVISRLADPIYMSKVHRNMFLSFLKHSIEDICVEIARKDDRRTFDALLDFGYLNDENLLRVIERVSNIQDAAMTGYLLEVRRRLFNKEIIDFEL